MSTNITVTTRQILARELNKTEALTLVSLAEYEARSTKGRLLSLMTVLDQASGKAPPRVKLFGFGANDTTKGAFFLSQEGANRCLAAHLLYGNDLVIDKDHLSLWGDSTAYGWFGLAVDSEGIWADTPLFYKDTEGNQLSAGILWLENGKSLVESLQFRYISPVFWTEYDEQGRELIVEILNFALTNIPATKNRAPLINSRGQTEEENNMSVTTNISVTTQAEILNQVCALTGETDGEKIKGALSAFSQFKTQHSTALTELSSARSEVTVLKTKLRKLEVDQLVKDGKLPPALATDALAMSDDALASMVKFLGGVTLPANQVQVTPPATNTDTPEGAAASLSKEEKAHCKAYQLDESLFAANKKAMSKNKAIEL